MKKHFTAAITETPSVIPRFCSGATAVVAWLDPDGRTHFQEIEKNLSGLLSGSHLRMQKAMLAGGAEPTTVQDVEFMGKLVDECITACIAAAKLELRQRHNA